MRLIGLLLLLECALLADSVCVAARGPRNLLAASRSARRARVVAAPQEQPSDKEVPEPTQAGPPLGLQDLILDSPADNRGGADDLAEMRAKVKLFQMELDAQKKELEMEEEELETELGFFGEPFGDFLSNTLKSVPDYEVPPPGALATKILLTIVGFFFALAFCKAVDAFVLELFRPFVQYKVSGLPNMPL